MMYCKKKIVWNVLENNWLKVNWKIFVTIICGLHFDRIAKISFEKYDEKCYDHWYLSILFECVQLLKKTEL